MTGFRSRSPRERDHPSVDSGYRWYCQLSLPIRLAAGTGARLVLCCHRWPSGLDRCRAMMRRVRISQSQLASLRQVSEKPVSRQLGLFKLGPGPLVPNQVQAIIEICGNRWFATAFFSDDCIRTSGTCWSLWLLGDFAVTDLTTAWSLESFDPTDRYGLIGRD